MSYKDFDISFRVIEMFNELLTQQGFLLKVKQNGVFGTQYRFTQISCLTGVTEIYITCVKDTTPTGLELHGIQIDHIVSSTRGIGIGAKLIAILSQICKLYHLDLFLWSKGNLRLNHWYEKLGFVENYTNTNGETLFVLKRFEFINAEGMYGNDNVMECSNIDATMRVAVSILKALEEEE